MSDILSQVIFNNSPPVINLLYPLVKFFSSCAIKGADMLLGTKMFAIDVNGFNIPITQDADENGDVPKYYDIDLNLLKPYIKDISSGMANYVLQNPIGSVYIQGIGNFMREFWRVAF